MTTKEAIEALFEKPFKECGIPDLKENTWKSYKKRFKEDKLPVEKIEEILGAAGYKVVQEKLWTR